MRRVIWVIVASLVLAFSFGCASSRYLSEEQDAAMREVCENPENDGCAVVTGRVWRAIQKLLSGGRI